MTQRLADAELLNRLVGFDSTSRNSNFPIADFICDYLDRPGTRIQHHRSPDGTKTNLIISIGPPVAEDRHGLVLSGHMDVVPAEEDDWRSDPFELVERNGDFYGRGVCDMKGFLALAVGAASRVDPQHLRHPLVLLFTYDEELGTLGARHFAETGDATVLPRSTIVGEPTSLKVVRAHKGHLFVRITFSGTSAHSAYPHLGDNAIEPAATAIVALSEFGRSLEHERLPSSELFPEAPYTCLSVTQVAGGTAVNVIPDHCEVALSARLLPGLESPAFADRLRRVIDAALAGRPYGFEVASESPALLLDEHAPVYRRLCAEVAQDETHSASYTTDAGWFQTLGLDCAVCGPGSVAVAHKPNESLPVSEFVAMADILQRVIHWSCERAD